MASTLISIVLLILLHSPNTVTQISPIFTTSSTLTSTTSITPSQSVTPIVTPTPVVTTPTTTTPVAPNTACSSEPCLNGATCQNLIPKETNFECTCADGFSGNICDEKVRSNKVDVVMTQVVINAIVVTANSPDEIKNLLTNKGSNLFRQACNLLKRMMRLVFQVQRKSLRNVICVSFFFASVHGDLVVQTPNNDTSSPTELLNTVVEGIKKVEKNFTKELAITTDAITVKDFNECNETKGYCDSSAICVNLPGSFRCDCPTGYNLVNSNKCIPKTTTSQTDLLTIVIPSVAGLLLLISIIIAILVWRSRKRQAQATIDSVQFLQSRRLRAVPRYPTFTSATRDGGFK